MMACGSDPSVLRAGGLLSRLDVERTPHSKSLDLFSRSGEAHRRARHRVLSPGMHPPLQDDNGRRNSFRLQVPVSLPWTTGEEGTGRNESQLSITWAGVPSFPGRWLSQAGVMIFDVSAVRSRLGPKSSA